MGQHHPCLERHTVAGIHMAADPLSIVGTRIADSYRAGNTAGNHPVPEVAAAAGNNLVPGVAAVTLALYRLRMEVVARWKTYS
jgi:hypothetical protein